MTGLLVSVRNAEEAATVSRFPVAILDVKEPNQGALGAADPATLREIARVVSGHQTMSFAAGELLQWCPSNRHRIHDALSDRYGDLLLRFGYLKIGLAGVCELGNWQRDWQMIFRNLPNNISTVMVSYFDHQRCDCPSPESLIEFASSQPNCSTILFDTYDKAQNLFAHITEQKLALLINDARRNGLHTVIAGSVDQACLANVLALHPDYVGVRGAVCRGQRTSQIDGRLVNEFASRLQPPIQGKS